MNESRVLSETVVDDKKKKISCMTENITEHETSKEVFKMKILQRSDETTAFSKKLKTAMDQNINLKILTTVNWDERKRFPKLREKSETRIITENNKLIRNSQQYHVWKKIVNIL